MKATLTITKIELELFFFVVDFFYFDRYEVNK